MSAPRQVLRGLELIEDDWRHAAEVAPAGPAPDALIVPLAELARVLTETARPRRLGVRLAPGDAVETLEPYLAQLELVAIEFPGPGEGRGYSAARLLRERLGFRHEIRAVGKVKQDQLLFMARCGFDAFELAPGESLEGARRALQRFDVAYQLGARVAAQRSGSATSANS
jgi:uncharacterized protein (DUF934 family)